MDPPLGAAARKPITSALGGAVREQLRQMLAAEPFTIATLRSIEQVAHHSRNLLGTCPDAGLDDAIAAAGILGAGGILDGVEEMGEYAGDYTGPILQPAGFGENFGGRAVRELMALLPKLFESQQRPSPVQTIMAIAEARTAGLTDLAAELEAGLRTRLGVGGGNGVKAAGFDVAAELEAELAEPAEELPLVDAASIAEGGVA